MDMHSKRLPNRQFGLLLGCVLLGIAGYDFVFGHAERWWPIPFGGTLIAVALLMPALLGPFTRLWLRLGEVLHTVTTPIVMGIIYFGVVCPTGAILRYLGKDPMQRRFDRDAASYWIKRTPPGPPGDSMRDQF